VKRKLPEILAASFVLSGFLLIGLAPGCATWQSNAGKVLASTALTVDASMKGWATYVVKNNISDHQQAPVKDAYAKYQLAMTAAQSAYGAAVANGDQSGWVQAQAALTASSTALTQLIGSLTTKAP
jgi:hypothetical protein